MPGKEPLTMYSFGYWGCGGATQQLVAALNAAEQARGFKPPLWVDIRFRRVCRAQGFTGNAFGELLGEQYLWIQDLGNELITDGSGRIRIKNPAAAATLLNLALEDPMRHVIFFCACQHPSTCHRRTVSHLLIKDAQARGVALEVIEWPGESPKPIKLTVPLADVRKARRMSLLDPDEPGTLKRLAIPKSMTMAEAASIPWGSLAELNAGDETGYALVGCARFGANGPYLPVLASAASDKGATVKAQAWLAGYGYNALRTK